MGGFQCDWRCVRMMDDRLATSAKPLGLNRLITLRPNLLAILSLKSFETILQFFQAGTLSFG